MIARFKNKTQMIKYFKDILNNSNIGLIVEDKTKTDVHKLLTKYRENSVEHRGIINLYVDKNKYGKKHFIYTYIDDYLDIVKDSFSYIKAVDFMYGKKEKPIEKFRCSMRQSLEDDHKEFKKAWLRVMPYCEISGELMTIKNSHVDHFGDFEFRHIFDGFCDMYEVDYINIKYDETINGSICQDLDIIGLFKKYHDSKCKLRVITAKANLSRGIK